MSIYPPDALAIDEPILEKGFEWVNGHPSEKPMSVEAGVVISNLTRELGNFVVPNRLGLVISQDCGYQIVPNKPKQVRKPDLTFMAKGRLKNDVAPRVGNLKIPPDLAAEVISPNDIAEDFEERVADLQSAGVRLLWIIYPKTHSVWILRKDGTGARLVEGQELSGDDVLPGFSIPVANLFLGLETLP